jgi:hypothetical protein
MIEERRDYAVLVSLMMREEAEVMAGALRADGIDAFIGNTNHSGINWFYLIALGGLQVMVPRARLADAKQAVRERILENADAFPEDQVQRRDRWKMWMTIAGYFLLWAAAYLAAEIASRESSYGLYY